MSRLIVLLRALPALLLAFLTAVIATTLFGSLVQTQLALAALSGLGVEITVGERLAASGADLVGFAPMYAGIVALGFLLAFPVAALLTRCFPGLRHRLYALAGAVAILTALLLMRTLLGLSPVSSARGVGGMTLHTLAGAVGGLAFAAQRRPQRTP
jgi:hypothetical protein